MSTYATHEFDLEELRRRIEARDAAAQLDMFADDAEVVIVDATHPPSTPQRMAGRDAIKAYLDDLCARDMTHKVQHAMAADDHAAFMVACRYADDTRVQCATLLDVHDGHITRQEVVQAWDA